MKVVFCGSHELGKLCLEKLYENDIEISAVFIPDTDNEWYKGVEETVKKHGLNSIKTNNINKKVHEKYISNINPDLIISVNFSQILKPNIIRIPVKGCINLHASLLPKYRGRAPLNWAIINGEDKTGVTCHYIDEGIDTGDIILQKEIKINEEDYIGDILKRVKTIYPEILLESIELIKNDNVDIIEKENEGFYCGRRRPEDGQIEWDKSAEDIYNLIRAVSKPYPGAYSYINDKKVLIWKAKILDKINNKEAKPGKVIDINDDGCIVFCKDGYILLEEVETNLEINIGDEFNFKEEDQN